MINVSFNGIDMAGKSTLMSNVQERLDKKNLKVGISPHLMKFADMSFRERLAMYEEWSPDLFTKQALDEVRKRLEYTKREFSGYDLVCNDRGVLTQFGFCMGKYMTEGELTLEESFQAIEEESRRIPFEDLSVVLDLPLEAALVRTEGKEVWGEHYQELIVNTREALKYLSTQDHIQNIFNLRGVENPNKLCDIVINKILSYKKPEDDGPK